MLYDINLTIEYEYARPAAAGRHLLRLMPLEIPGVQRVVAGSLDIAPFPDERAVLTDFFGNIAHEVVFRAPHDELSFRVRARVERWAAAPSLDISPDLARLASEIAACRGLDPDAPHHFLGASPHVRPTPEMTAYAWAAIGPHMTAFGVVSAVGAALHRDMRYDGEATTVDTPIAEAFANRHGVCQDFAQVMIACLRGVGVPAGYVSGVLRTNPPPGQARLEGADATHAWVRAWCGFETGWVEYDPTNALVVGADHVAIARGRDYSDVPPVAGILRTAGSQQTSRQSVDVLPLAPAPLASGGYQA